MTEKYEGWANRETWATVLWIRNDEPLYRQAVAMGPSLVETIERDGLNSADELAEEWIEGLVLGDEPASNLATDLLTGALGRVNWREVVAAIIEDSSEEEN